MLARVLQNTSIYAAGEVLGRLAVFALVPIYTTLLLPEELAVWGLGAMLIQGLTVLHGLGTTAALPQFQYARLEDPAALRRLNGSVAMFLLLWAPALHLSLEAVGPGLLARWAPTLPWQPYGRLVSLSAAVAIAGVIPIARWTTEERPRPYVAASFSRSLLELAITLGLLLGTSYGVLSLFVGRLGAQAVLAVPLLVVTLRSVDWRIHRADLFAVLAFALPLVPDLLAAWALTMGDRLVLSWLSTDRELGLYTAAYWFPFALTLIAINANRAWAPTFHKAVVAGEESDPRSATVFVAGLAWCGLATTLLAPDVVRGLFGAAYADAAPVAGVLGLAGVALGAWQVGVASLYAGMRRVAIPMATATAALVGLGLDLWAVPRWGALGAAWATVASYALLAALVWALGSGTTRPRVDGAGLGFSAGLLLAVGALGWWGAQGLGPVLSPLLDGVLLLTGGAGIARRLR